MSWVATLSVDCSSDENHEDDEGKDVVDCSELETKQVQRDPRKRSSRDAHSVYGLSSASIGI